jgi:hypothetical protein
MLPHATDASLRQLASDVEAAFASDCVIDAAASASGTVACASGVQAGPNWTLRIHTMTGLELVVPCAELELTTIGHIKGQIFEQRSDWLVHRQCLMLPVGDRDEAPFVSDHPSLNDDLTLLACGLYDGAMLELLLKEDEWAASDQALLEKVRNCGHVFTHSECSNRECHILARSILDEVIYETRFILYFYII